MSVAAVGAFAQGTVTFLNDTTTLSTPPDRFVRYGQTAASVGLTPGAGAGGTNIQVQLYYGTSGTAESALIPLSAAPARLRVSTSSAVGTWSAGGARTFQTAAAGAQLTLQVRVWDINFGSTYEAAFANGGGFQGKSATFGYVVPQPADPPASFVMANFGGVTIDIVPEPGSFALAGLGAAAGLAAGLGCACLAG